jgi:GNAT superfamily N-acetyltransferase
MFREAVNGDLQSILRLLRQLHPDDPETDRASLQAIFEAIIRTPGLRIFVLEEDGRIVATAYLNVIANLTRSGSPYAVTENVVVEESLRRTGLGKRIIEGTLSAAWGEGCYKAMLATGSRRAATHAFYRACGLASDEKTAYVAHPPE